MGVEENPYAAPEGGDGGYRDPALYQCLEFSYELTEADLRAAFGRVVVTEDPSLLLVNFVSYWASFALLKFLEGLGFYRFPVPPWIVAMFTVVVVFGVSLASRFAKSKHRTLSSVALGPGRKSLCLYRHRLEIEAEEKTFVFALGKVTLLTSEPGYAVIRTGEGEFVVIPPSVFSSKHDQKTFVRSLKRRLKAEPRLFATTN